MSKFLYFLLVLMDKVVSYIKTAAYSSVVTAKAGVRFSRSSRVVNIRGSRNSIKIDKNTFVRGELLTFRHGGEIIIGNYCYIGEMSRIWSASSVVIGDRVLIAHNVNIHDNNAHPLDANMRHLQYKSILSLGHLKEDSTLNEKPITIGDDVWIGFNATILKGIKIGNGAIIAACSVVTKDVESFTLVAGNPAKEIKKLK